MNQKRYNKVISSLLILSMVLLTILIPGGPIETRDFSHISPTILQNFNIFLTTTGIVSLLILFFIFKGKRWSYFISFLCGLSYFCVYILDLGKIFPVSPTKMPQALLIIEVIGTIISIPLMVLSLKSYVAFHDTQESKAIKNSYFWLAAIILGLLGILIVIFATNSAMGK